MAVVLRLKLQAVGGGQIAGLAFGVDHEFAEEAAAVAEGGGVVAENFCQRASR